MAGRAAFVFWWAGVGEHGEPVAFFNVRENDRGHRNGSTVDAAQLLTEYGIPVPPHPSYPDWCRKVGTKRRCAKCWAVIRGPEDLRRHREIVHREKQTVFSRPVSCDQGTGANPALGRRETSLWRG